jgi:cytochrome c oxidase subunit 4
MTETPATRRRPNYMLIFVFLGVLTAVEVGVTFTGLPKSVQVPLLIVLAIAKATLVGMYYMHLRYEGRVLRFVALGPLLLAIILTLPPLFDLIGHH